jgi:hypothetical protein
MLSATSSIGPGPSRCAGSEAESIIIAFPESATPSKARLPIQFTFASMGSLLFFLNNWYNISIQHRPADCAYPLQAHIPLAVDHI